MSPRSESRDISSLPATHLGVSVRRRLIGSMACILVAAALASCATAQEETPQVGPTGDQSTVMPQTDAPVVDLPPEEQVEPVGLNEAPEGWPSTVPVPAGGSLQAWTEVDNTFNASWLFLSTDVPQVADAYASALQAAGWQGGPMVEGTGDAQGTFTGSFALDNSTITVLVRPSAGSGEVDVTVEHVQG